MERPFRVLIADDRRAARRGLRALLSLFPEVEVIGEAADGQEALVLVSRHRPDVVVLDIEMPVIDGVEATRRVKGEWPEVRVVVLTIHATYRASALAAGADAFLLKGCTAQEMRRAILPSPRPAQGQTMGGGSGGIAANGPTPEGECYHDRHTTES